MQMDLGEMTPIVLRIWKHKTGRSTVLKDVVYKNTHIACVNKSLSQQLKKNVCLQAYNTYLLNF